MGVQMRELQRKTRQSGGRGERAVGQARVGREGDCAEGLGSVVVGEACGGV